VTIEERIADAVRRTLDEHSLCIEDAGDTPMTEWECDLLVMARALERRATARRESEGAGQ
jgi:hypothetical protein